MSVFLCRQRNFGWKQTDRLSLDFIDFAIEQTSLNYRNETSRSDFDGQIEKMKSRWKLFLEKLIDHEDFCPREFRVSIYFCFRWSNKLKMKSDVFFRSVFRLKLSRWREEILDFLSMSWKIFFFLRKWKSFLETNRPEKIYFTWNLLSLEKFVFSYRLEAPGRRSQRHFSFCPKPIVDDFRAENRRRDLVVLIGSFLASLKERVKNSFSFWKSFCSTFKPDRNDGKSLSWLNNVELIFSI